MGVDSPQRIGKRPDLGPSNVVIAQAIIRFAKIESGQDIWVDKRESPHADAQQQSGQDAPCPSCSDDAEVKAHQPIPRRSQHAYRAGPPLRNARIDLLL